MVDAELEAEFTRVLDEWQSLGSALTALSERLAIETLGDLLPGAARVEV